MSDNVTHLRAIEAGEGFKADPDAILEGAKGQGMTDVAICGYLPDGSLWVSSSCGDGATFLLIERAKFSLLHSSLEGES